MITKSISTTATLKGRRIVALRLAAWIGFLLMPFLTEAQTTLYWDGNGTTGGTGGTNTWTTSTSTANRRWRADSATGTLGSWSNSSPTDYAVFGGTAGTVSWASNISVRRITFTVSGYTLARTSNTLTLVTDGFIDTGSFNATISGPMAGTVGMTKLGSGTLTLSGASTYTGVTSINAGVLAVSSLANGGNNSNIGKSTSDAANLVLNGGTLRYTNTNAASTTNRLFTLGAGGGTLDASATGALTFSNTGAIAYTGTGNRTLTLTGSSTAGNTLAAAIANPAGNTTSIVKSSGGTWVVSGNNTYSGTTTIEQGTFAFGSNTAAGTSVITVNGGTLSASGGERTIANNVVVGGNFTIGGTDNLKFEGSINLGGGTRTITVNNTGLTTFAGSITQPYYSGLVKAGTGTLVLSGDNSYAAPTSINAGTLVLASNTALGASGIYGHTIASGATLALQGDVSVNQAGFNLSGSGVGGNGAIRNLSGNNTLGGSLILGGATTITSDSGTLTLTG
ncbi:MAG TPA: autotransporter-associated beta strand repeat-containing protein, partial [Opitutus sp.]|nr:autotransporter-associated beta strand repeat-containing protein [Opitutus sp.]